MITMNKNKKDLDKILKSLKDDAKKIKSKKDDMLNDLLKKIKNIKK